MGWIRKRVQAPCTSCGDEGAEFCRLCRRFLCDECLDGDYRNHKEEAKKWTGQQHLPLSVP